MLRETGGVARPASTGEGLCRFDVIDVGGAGSAVVRLANQSVVRLDANSSLRIVEVAPEPDARQRTLLDQIKGVAYYFSRQPRSLTVSTPFINAGIEGTEFLVQVEADRATVIVYEGTVVAGNDQGTQSVASGRAVVAERGAAPAFVQLIRPRDAVQWALYYPPILLALADASGAAAETVAPPVREPVRLAARGEYAAALDAFDRVPAGDRDADYVTFRAATLLSIGRVEDARAAIDQALQGPDPAATAYAVRAVIAVAQNEPDRAAADAEEAVRRDPDSAAAYIALSYAEQARFRLGAARQAVERAVELEPNNGLAFARLAELRLAFGDSRRAIETAEKARLLAPEVERVHSVLGFAYLTRFRTDAAANAFRRAILIDPAAPLPRFGLGLATIRDGALSAGRADIETAVALDPDNALLRAYLGKAYFDERTTNPLTYFNRLISQFSGGGGNTLAAEQFAQAKALDPNDPTPWFYDALRLQSENRPVEALRNLEKSIALNDNRAVYRSRELLDADRAARGASLARVYTDLGMEKVGTNEASKSLALDPTNTAAHRFLSDTLVDNEREEISRLSALLQAQLFQDINIDPVRPSQSQAGLNIPTTTRFRPGFNEFSPLFERNRVQLNASGEIGNQETLSNEAVLSAVYDNISVSAGQFHYQTDGFRDNNELEHNIYNFFTQVALTPELNIQGEYRRRETERGDLDFNFNKNDFDPDIDIDETQNTGRIGIRYSLDHHSTFIASGIYNDIDTKDPRNIVKSKTDSDGYQAEAGYIFDRGLFNLFVGGGYYDVDTKRTSNVFIPGFPPFFPDLQIEAEEDFDIDQKNAFAYLNVNFPADVIWTVGLSYDDFEVKQDSTTAQNGVVTTVSSSKTGTDSVNPKIGVQWTVIDGVRLRGAAFRSTKRALVASQTIEPTQVAGFNQFFDDLNGSESTTFAAGIDLAFGQRVYAGFEYYHRDIDDPGFSGPDNVTFDRDEDVYRGYLTWLATDQLVLGTEVRFEAYDNDETLANANIDPAFPTQVDTLSVPVTARYFHPTGFFGVAGVTFVRQDVNRPPESPTAEGDSTLFPVDALLGFRFPEQRGSISVEARNILDESFQYQDNNFRSFQQDGSSISPFLPERTIIGRLVLNF